MSSKIDEFIKTIMVKRGDKSVAKPYDHLLKKFGEWLVGKGKAFDDFTATDVDLFMSTFEKPGTANVFLAGIREYAKFRVQNASDEDFIREDRRYHALEMIKYRKVPRKIKKESLNLDEVETLLDVISEDEVLHAGVVTGFYFGWRPVEGTVNLRSAEINWRRRYIKLETAKAGHERLLPWHDSITPYLKEWYESTKRISKMKRPEEWLTKRLKARCGRFFNMPVTAKTFRKTFETHFRKTDVEQWMIDFLMGHTVKVPDRYSDWTELLEDLRYPMEEKHYLLGVLT